MIISLNVISRGMLFVQWLSQFQPKVPLKKKETNWKSKKYIKTICMSSSQVSGKKPIYTDPARQKINCTLYISLVV